jgi:hypothetical protein
MERLPVKFEEEVLNKHEITWYEPDVYEGMYHGEFPISEYEIAGIALENMKYKCLDKNWYLFCVFNADMWEISIEENTYDGEGDTQHFVVKDEDFCTCIFKAIKEICK